MMEQEADVVLLDEAPPAPQPWMSRRLLGVVGVVGLVCTATMLPRQWSSKKVMAPKEKMAFMQAQGLPGPYGAQQGYGAGVGNGATGAPIAAHPENFIAHADAPGNGGAGGQPAYLPGVPTPVQPAAGFPGPYGAQQGYGAGVGNGATGAPLPNHPAGFIPFAEAQAMSNGGASAQPAPAQPAPAQPAGLPAPGPYGAQQGYGAGVGNGPTGAPIAAHPEGFIAHGDAPGTR